MSIRLNFKALGYGLATFVTGYAVVWAIGPGEARSDGTTFGNTIWLLRQVFGYFVPVIAGYVAAYHASNNRVINGTLGGGLWIILFLLPAAFAHPVPFIPMVVAAYALLAALGAIVANFWCNRFGP